MQEKPNLSKQKETQKQKSRSMQYIDFPNKYNKGGWLIGKTWE